MRKRYQHLNGYVLKYTPTHPKAITSNNYKGYVYEHILIAEQMLGRYLSDNEEVHHLDEIRNNNHSKNLLVLSKSAHTKLHNWLRKQNITAKIINANKYCLMCKKPIYSSNKGFCSTECYKLYNRKGEKPSAKQLLEDLKRLSMTDVGRRYNVSDTSVRKWLKTYNLPTHNKDYSKVKYIEVK